MTEEARPSREDIETNLIVTLADMEWFDVTDAELAEYDEPIAKAYIAGRRSRIQAVYMAVRWADGTASVQVMSDRYPGQWRNITGDSFKAAWLLAIIEGRPTADVSTS